MRLLWLPGLVGSRAFARLRSVAPRWSGCHGLTDVSSRASNLRTQCSPLAILCIGGNQRSETVTECGTGDGGILYLCWLLLTPVPRRRAIMQLRCARFDLMLTLSDASVLCCACIFLFASSTSSTSYVPLSLRTHSLQQACLSLAKNARHAMTDPHRPCVCFPFLVGFGGDPSRV